MRTLKLTHAEIALLQRALGIAEMQFNSIRKTYLETLVNVRGVESLTIVREEADHMFQKENEFGDLLMSIKNGDKDV